MATAPEQAGSSDDARGLLDARALFDGFPQPVSVFSLDGRYRYVNAPGLEIIGQTAREVEGGTYLGAFPDLVDHPFHAAFLRVASGEVRSEELEFHYPPLDTWFSQRLQRVDDVVVVFSNDVTARRRSDDALRDAVTRSGERERLLRTVVEEMPQLAWTARADGFIDYYNPRWYEYTGTTRADMEGWGWQSVHDPALLPGVMETWAKAIAAGEPCELEFPLRRADGVFRWFLTRVAPTRDEGGAVVRWVGINTDVHEQRTALKQLDDTLEGMGDAFFLLDGDWRIVRVNRRQEALSQVRREQSVGRVFWEVFPATAVPTTAYWREYHRAVDEQVPVHFVDHYAPLDLWIEVDAYPSPGGGLAVFFRDVSERLRASSALAEERAVLDAVFREAPVGLAMFDEQLRYLRVNDVLADINGVPVEAHLGRPVFEVVPGLPTTLLDQWRDVLRTGEPLVGSEVVAVTSKDPGTPRIFKASVFPVRVGEKLIGLGNVVEEVTEERRLQDERREAIESLQLLAETSAALASSLDYEQTLARVAQSAVPRIADVCTVYVVVDGSVAQLAASHADGQLAEVVRSVHREATLDPDLPFGYPKVLRTGEAELMMNVTPEMLERAARTPRQLEMMHTLGPTSWIVVPLATQGKTTGAISFSRVGRRTPFTPADLTVAEEIGRRASLGMENARLYREAREAAAAERHARDKAEEATRLKDEFLATLSHELRTPLHAILGWGRLLQAGAVPAEKIERATDTIVRNAVAQNQLIDDLLDVSRIISGKLRLTVEPTDLGLIVESALEGVRPAADAKGVRLEKVVDPAVGLVSGDPARLTQVVWNLLTNAVKFTPRGGRVHVTVQREESSVQVAVADTGAGIAGDFLPFVFHRFRQEDGGISRKSGGLGLGLAIVKHLVELHGGVVEARSEGPTLGSVFVVKIPIAPVRPRSAPPSERGRPSPGSLAHLTCPLEIEGLKILVVDDEGDARDLVRAVLEQCKAEVATAANATEALAVLSTFAPDVIVSDIGMPEGDGYELIRKIRALPRDQGGRTPAVALTAYARPDDRIRALGAGFQSHASKPVDPQELLLVVANLAGRCGLRGP